MKLCEIAVSFNSQLSQEQKLCLLKVYMTSRVSADVASDSLAGDQKILAAAEYLMKFGMLASAGHGLSITQSGVAELTKNGIIDSTGVTEMGKELLGQTASAPKSSAVAS